MIENPLWVQALTYPARLDRALIAAVFGEGLLTGFAVSQRGAGANMSVDVAAGKAIVQGDDESNQGNYFVTSTAVENVVVSAAPGANSRYDIVVLQINDPNAGGAAGDNMQIQVIAGTAAASPVVPDTPDSALLLASIGPITTSTTSITTAMITNVAATATLAFDVVDDAIATRLGDTSATAGSIARRTVGTGQLAVTAATVAGNAVNKGQMDALFPIGTSQIADNAITQPKVTTTWVTLTNGSTDVRYTKIGTTVFVCGKGSSTETVTLPVGYRPPFTLHVQNGTGTGTITTTGVVTPPPGSTGFMFVFPA